MLTKTQKTRIRHSTMTVSFNGSIGGDLDEKVRLIFSTRGGRLLEQNMFRGIGIREVRYSVQRTSTKTIREELKALGVHSRTR